MKNRRFINKYSNSLGMNLDVGIIKELLGTDNRDKLLKIIKETESPDLAVIIDQLNDREKLKFYLFIPTKLTSDVLLEVSHHSRKFILKSLKDKYIVSMLEETESDDSADILGGVPEH